MHLDLEKKPRYENGIYDISNEDYHASEGLSRTALMKFKKSPYHYHCEHVRGMVPRKETEEMVLGNLVHLLILEPEKFHDEFVVRPDFNRRTNDGKFKYNQFVSTLAGRKEITMQQLKVAEAMRDSVTENADANHLLSLCEKEKSIYFTHKNTGIQCKVRPDAWKNGMVIDLKTSQDCEYYAFQRSAIKYGYFLQAGMIYQALESIDIQMTHFVIVAIEKAPPYAVALFTLDAETIELCSNVFDRVMSGFQKAIAADEFPSYPITNLFMPTWAAMLNDEE